MAATTHYGVKKYGADGVPGFRPDWDTAVDTLDTAIYNASTTAGAASTTAENAATQAGTAAAAATAALHYTDNAPGDTFAAGTLGKLITDMQATLATLTTAVNNLPTTYVHL